MSKLIINDSRCKSCGICIRECPRSAISMTDNFNAKGYRVIAVDEEKCIQCGICHWMCPDVVFELEG